MAVFVRALLAGLFALAGGATQAAPVLLDFEQLAHVGDPLQVSSGYVEDGFTITNLGLSSPPGSEFWVAGSNDPRFSGSTAMSNQIGGPFGVTALKAVDGSSFSLFGINLAALNTHGYGLGSEFTAPLVVTFTGVLAGGGSTTQSFTVDYATFAQQTFLFDLSFDGLSAVSWDNFAPYHQFDNIQINGASAIPDRPNVPEPGTLALLAIALAGLGYSRRRQ